MPPLLLPDPAGPLDPASIGSFDSVRLFTERAGDAARGSSGRPTPRSTSPICARTSTDCHWRSSSPLHGSDRSPSRRSWNGWPTDSGSWWEEPHRPVEAADAPCDLGVELRPPRRRGARSPPRPVGVRGRHRPRRRRRSARRRMTPRCSPLLGNLVDKSLVLMDESEAGSRYRLLETVREFGLGKLMESDEREDVERRHAKWFLELGIQGVPALARPDRGAWQRGSNRGRQHQDRPGTEPGVRPGAGSPDRRGDVAVLAMRAYLTEGRRWLDLALIGAPGRTDLQADGLLGAGVLSMRSGAAREGSAWRNARSRSIGSSGIFADRVGCCRRWGSPRSAETTSVGR